jgi:hypothetical protein
MLSNIAGKRKFRSRAGPTAMLTCRVSRTIQIWKTPAADGSTAPT